MVLCVNFFCGFVLGVLPSLSPQRCNVNISSSFLDRILEGAFWEVNFFQQVLNPTPLNPAPATCHKRKRKLRCSFRHAALQKLHCNIGFSAVRKSFGPKAALQQTKNCTATSKKLRCRKVALSCRFPAGFKPPRLGTHVSDLLILEREFFSAVLGGKTE